jgi:hypothetical protein
VGELGGARPIPPHFPFNCMSPISIILVGAPKWWDARWRWRKPLFGRQSDCRAIGLAHWVVLCADHPVLSPSSRASTAC